MHVPALPALQLSATLHSHWEAAQAKPLGHERPQAPQLVAVLVRSTQPAGVWQQVRPAAHARPPLQLQSPVRLQYSPCSQTAGPQ